MENTIEEFLKIDFGQTFDWDILHICMYHRSTELSCIFNDLLMQTNYALCPLWCGVLCGVWFGVLCGVWCPLWCGLSCVVCVLCGVVVSFVVWGLVSCVMCGLVSCVVCGVLCGVVVHPRGRRGHKMMEKDNPLSQWLSIIFQQNISQLLSSFKQNCLNILIFVDTMDPFRFNKWNKSYCCNFPIKTIVLARMKRMQLCDPSQ